MKAPRDHIDTRVTQLDAGSDLAPDLAHQKSGIGKWLGKHLRNIGVVAFLAGGVAGCESPVAPVAPVIQKTALQIALDQYEAVVANIGDHDSMAVRMANFKVEFLKWEARRDQLQRKLDEAKSIEANAQQAVSNLTPKSKRAEVDAANNALAAAKSDIHKAAIALQNCIDNPPFEPSPRPALRNHMGVEVKDLKVYHGKYDISAADEGIATITTASGFRYRLQDAPSGIVLRDPENGFLDKPAPQSLAEGLQRFTIIKEDITNPKRTERSEVSIDIRPKAQSQEVVFESTGGKKEMIYTSSPIIAGSVPVTLKKIPLQDGVDIVMSESTGKLGYDKETGNIFLKPGQNINPYDTFSLDFTATEIGKTTGSQKSTLTIRAEAAGIATPVNIRGISSAIITFEDSRKNSPRKSIFTLVREPSQVYDIAVVDSSGKSFTAEFELVQGRIFRLKQGSVLTPGKYTLTVGTNILEFNGSKNINPNFVPQPVVIDLVVRQKAIPVEKIAMISHENISLKAGDDLDVQFTKAPLTHYTVDETSGPDVKNRPFIITYRGDVGTISIDPSKNLTHTRGQTETHIITLTATNGSGPAETKTITLIVTD